MRIKILSILFPLFLLALPRLQAETQDLSFGIADIKYDGTTLKILELGEGTTSMFAGYDSLYGEGAMWKNIWHFLSNKNPIFLVDHEATTPANRRRIGYSALIQHGGIATTSLEALANNKEFIRNNQGKTPVTVVIRHVSADTPHIKKFQARFPNAIICNAAIAPFVNDKKSTDQLFTGALRAFRPWACTARKIDVLSTVDQILATCMAKQFVIKPLASCKGDGILFSPRNQLAQTLQSIIYPHQRCPMTKTDNKTYWLSDTQTELLIESCETSKPIDVDGKKYDATLRVVYGLMTVTPVPNLTRDDRGPSSLTTPVPSLTRGDRIPSSLVMPSITILGSSFVFPDSDPGSIPSITILGCYWKLPRKPLDAPGSLEDKKLSHVETGARCAAPVSDEDVADITVKLLPMLNEVYATMLSIK